MKMISLKRAAAALLAVLLLPAPVRAAEAPTALPDTTQEGNVQSYYVSVDTAYTIYWAQGITPPLMTADDAKLNTEGYFHRTEADKSFVTFEAPYAADQGYFDLNQEPEDDRDYLAAAVNVLHWWLDQSGEFLPSYLAKLQAGQLQQPEGLKPLAPYDQQLWDQITGAPGEAGARELGRNPLTGAAFQVYAVGKGTHQADTVWDYFLNGFSALEDSANTAENFQERMDSTGGYFYPVFGATPISSRLDQTGFAFADENFRKLLNEGYGLTLRYGAEEDTHILTLWGAEYDENNRLVRIYVTDSADGDAMIGQEPRGLFSVDVKVNGEGQLLLAVQPGVDLPLQSFSALSLGREAWEKFQTVPDPQNPEAAVPVITAQPQSADYTLGDAAADLSVGAEASDGGALSYQWYQAADEAAPGTVLAEATGSTLKPSVEALGTTYYYCEITNTLEGQTASVISNRAAVTVKEAAAAAPVITVQPQSAEYTLGDAAADLSVSAEASDGGVLSYQWYRAEEEASEGTAIAEAVGASLKLSTEAQGKAYYYCVITNTLGEKTASVTSQRAVITVNQKPIVVAAPEITAHPKSAEYTVGDTAEALSVTASGSEGTVLTYQWYLADSDTAEGKPLEKATESSLNLGTQQAGTAWFYCVVTASNPQDSSRTASAESARARITVKEKVIDAQKPELKTQPKSAGYLTGDTAKALTVEAQVTDGGKLSYQWYAAKSGSDQGEPIENATEASLTPSTEKAGTVYYYCVVTNTSAADASRTASAATNRAEITVKDKSSLAKAPEIKSQPVSATYTLHDSAKTLSVKAESPDGGELSYQWYRSGSATGQGTAIQGATGTTCKPAADQIGISYYYCLVTNTRGREIATRETERAKITVTAPSSAKAPQISAQPKDAAYIVGDASADLSVSATSLDGGKLSYQWYASDSETGKGTPIKDATGSGYKPSTGKTGVTWYYCVVTNTNAADKDLTATATTNRAKVTVKKAEQVLVKRDLTKVDPNLEKAGFQSVTAIEKAMTKALPKRDTPYGAVYYDICLEQILADGSRVPAVEFPEDGLTFTLSYPKGTQKKGFDFVAVHMITTGSKAGTVELPKIRLTNNGIQMTLDSLSPVMIAWTETESSKPAETTKPPKKPDSPSTGDSTPVGLLVGVVLVSGAALATTAYFVFRKKKNDK